MKVVWKSDITDFGEQSVMITSTTLMLALPAIVLDSGWYWFGFIFTARCTQCKALY